MIRVLTTFVLILAAAFAATGSASSATEEDPRSNIVLIVADDMRADDLEYMPQTRELLVEQGLTFSNAFVTHSLCCPSRASILRGQYTHNHQVLTNTRPEGGFEKFRSMGHEDSTVATWLQDGGYRTVLLGKYLNGYSRGDKTHVPPSWDEWYGRLTGDDYYDYQVNENGDIFSYGATEEDYYTDVLARMTKDYLQRTVQDPSPFFMYVAPQAPHGPFIPAPRHAEEYPDARAPRPPSFNEPDVGDKPAWVRGMEILNPATTTEIDAAYRARLRMLLSLDELVAGLVAELESSGELDDTYVFFTSDNGYHLGEHRLARGKRTVYEEAVRVPLAVRGPGVPAGQVVEQTALNIDLAPTLAELSGVPAPSFVDGRSLVPLLSGTPPATWRSAFLIEHWSGGNVPQKLTPTFTAIRTRTSKYVEYDTGEKELYDLSSDPYELQSVHASADPALAESLASRLQTLTTCAGSLCRTTEDGP